MIYSLSSEGEHLWTMHPNINMWRTPPDIVTQQSVTLNGLVHMEANPLRMLSLLCRTHAVQLYIYVIIQIPIPAMLWPQGRQARPRKTPFLRTLAFRAGRTFRAYAPFHARTPASSGIPLIRPPGTRPARLPRVSLATPERPLVLLPRKVGYPHTKWELSLF